MYGYSASMGAHVLSKAVMMVDEADATGEE
jgi:hypothetical protein